MIVITALGKFRSRQSEWEKSAIVAGMGAIFLAPNDAMASPGLAFMLRVMSEEAWGALFLVLGGLALLALWINGRRDRVTTWARYCFSVARFVLFLALSVAAALKGDWGVGQVLWPAFMVTEAASIYFTIMDTGSASAHGIRPKDRKHASGPA